MTLPDFLKPTVISDSLSSTYKLRPLVFLGCILVSSIVVTNIIGVKIMTLFGLNFTAGVVTYGVTFLCTDLISEIWGKRTAYYFVLLGFLCSLFMLLFVWLAINSPPAVFWEAKQEAYDSTLGGVKRIVMASMVAYLLSQLHDVWAFDYWRRVTKGRWLWVRNNLSTMASQVIDTVIFILVAFVGQLTAPQIFTLIAGQIAIKWAIAWAETPIILLVAWWLGPPLEGAHPDYGSKKV